MQTRMCMIVCAVLAFAASGTAQDFRPDIPKAWDDKEVERFEMPLVQRDRSPRYMTSGEYYALKIRPIYRSYPMYAPGREPAGYIESLKQKEPEVIFEPSRLHTKQDWIDAGRLVFESDILIRPAPARPDHRWMAGSCRCRKRESSPALSAVTATTSAKKVCSRWGLTPAPNVIRA